MSTNGSLRAFVRYDVTGKIVTDFPIMSNGGGDPLLTGYPVRLIKD